MPHHDRYAIGVGVATQDQAVLEAGMMMARGLVKLLATLRGNVASFDERIAERVCQPLDRTVGVGQGLLRAPPQ